MLLAYSYDSKEKDRVIEGQVGRSFGWRARFKLGGTGSQKFVIRSANQEITSLFDHQSGEIFTNIELRTKGIALWLRSRVDVYLVLIPYYQLSVFRNGGMINVYGGQWRLQLKPAHNQMLNTKFLNKLLKLKSEYVEESSLPVE